MISELLSMLSSSSFWLTFFVLSAIPYGMYLVAYLFEGRLPGNGPNDVPVWKDQSRAFMPGDFGLALFVAVAGFYQDTMTFSWAEQPFWVNLLIPLFGLGVYFGAREFLYREADYTRAAWESPSKRYHDVVMFLAFSIIAAGLCVPFYFFSTWSGIVLSKLLGVFGLALWIVGNVYDFTHNETPNARQHPTVYQPIWRKQVAETIKTR